MPMHIEPAPTDTDAFGRPIQEGSATRLSRRQLMAAGFFGVLGASLTLSGTGEAAYADDALELEGDGYLLRADGATVLLVDAAGAVRQKFRGYRTGSLTLTSGTSAIGQAEDGTAAIVVSYDVSVDGASVTGTFTPRGRRFDVVFDIVYPGAVSAATGMMRREVPSGQVVETFTGVADWVRDARGGIPYQTNGRSVFEQDLGDDRLYIVAPGSNSSWRDGWSIHLPGTVVSDGVFRASAGIVFTGEESPVVIDALATGSPLAADLATDVPYNVFESSSGLAVTGTALNGRDARAVTFAWTVHDWNGAVVSSCSRTHDVAPAGTVSDTLAFSLADRGIAFVELTVTAGDDEAYARTNVAVLPPHVYDDTAEESFFGIAADYLLGPAEERELLRRIGVRHSRHGHFSAAELQEYGFAQHRLRTPPSLDEYDGDDAALASYVEAELDAAEAASADHYECANEWNMKGGVLQGVGAEKYVTKWASAFRQGLDARQSGIGLIPVGLAGMDYVYAQNMFDAGLADVADAFNLHPGRGNFTPDYAPDPSGWATGSTGSYWNYYGALKEARRMIDENTDGSMEFWITEAYTPTKPNSWWDDSYRHAAENVLLSIALAASVGVTAMLWFQFYDNIKANQTGASETNREYHFGLLLRDHSPKPSLVAYASAAEQLDGASFTRWLDFGDDEKTRGLQFDSPRGPLVVLWTRDDGYTLNTEGTRDGSFFPEPEPWVDTWPTKRTLVLAAAGTVTCVDAVGQSTDIPVAGGQAQLVLDGAPRIYYGLDVSALA